jgi:hypothetical protein
MAMMRRVNEAIPLKRALAAEKEQGIFVEASL